MIISSCLSFRKGRGTRDQIANILWIMEIAREFQRNICFFFSDYAKSFGCVDYNTLWKIPKEMGIPNTLPASWEIHMQVKKQQLELDMEQRTVSKKGKGVHQGCILSPCLFNLYAEYIMWNVGLNEAQAGIKIAGRNINKLRYTDDTALLAEKEDLKSLWWKRKRRVKKLA